MNYYKNNKEIRAEQAKKHTKEMEEKYRAEIERSVKETIVYDTDFESKENYFNKTDIIIEPLDSVASIFEHAKHCKGKIAVLNFASYKNPGGGFINGSKAQEECLCYESFLYNVLSQFASDFYDWNIRHKNKALYLNRGLYSPGVIFSKKGYDIPCDVITCAAPNKAAAQKYENVSGEENTVALKSRIKFVLDIAKDNHVDTLILGAFGCGVFGQDAKEVASIFKEYLTTTHRCFETVVFAIPEGKDGNFGTFMLSL